MKLISITANAMATALCLINGAFILAFVCLVMMMLATFTGALDESIDDE